MALITTFLSWHSRQQTCSFCLLLLQKGHSPPPFGVIMIVCTVMDILWPNHLIISRDYHFNRHSWTFHSNRMDNILSYEGRNNWDNWWDNLDCGTLSIKIMGTFSLILSDSVPWEVQSPNLQTIPLEDKTVSGRSVPPYRAMAGRLSLIDIFRRSIAPKSCNRHLEKEWAQKNQWLAKN